MFAGWFQLSIDGKQATSRCSGLGQPMSWLPFYGSGIWVSLRISHEVAFKPGLLKAWLQDGLLLSSLRSLTCYGILVSKWSPTAVVKSQSLTGSWLERLSTQASVLCFMGFSVGLVTQGSLLPQRDRWEKKKNCCKELVHTVRKVGKIRICRVGWQIGDPGKSCSLNPQVCWQNFLFFRGGQSLFY